MPKQENFLQQIKECISTPFNEMEFCQLCGGYDTIQIYYKVEGRAIHVCEKCHDKYRGKINKLLTPKSHR